MRTLYKLDKYISHAFSYMLSSLPSLIILTFHHIFENDSERSTSTLFPQHGITVNEFTVLLSYLMNSGYSFISPADLTQNYNTSKNEILITFDDGYYNNMQAIKILNSYKIPSIIFITTNNIKYNRAFWWDVLYREYRQRGFDHDYIERRRKSLKHECVHTIYENFAKEFGENAITPRSDLDRPLTESELKQLSDYSNVYIGNHTADHEIITRISHEEMIRQIENSQEYLMKVTGNKSQYFAFPNNEYNPEIMQSLKKFDIQFSFTMDERKNYFPLQRDIDRTIILNRFTFNGTKNIARQMRSIRSDIHMLSWMKTWKNRY